MNPFETWTLEAFLRAVSQADKPLPQDLQDEIRRIGHALENHNFNVIREIPALVERDVALDERYKLSYRSLQKQYQVQERAKSLALAVSSSTSYGLESQIAQVLNADDIVGAARRFVSRLDERLTIGSSQDDFWKRGDRVIALASGGAFLGVLLAQIPGAIIGGLLAAAYAWFTAPQVESDRKA
ncbi:hypothetical protein [Leptolyngbya sp. FACHB-711]|uniref:hypothetical protein n=1 Tax=Leptolyngbya sp. FACHB-711 TaxID=2692813 RepID=UPI0016869DFF|nr:hypothetical protein [Leptolyngbya sp. FACHB-711]MBD2028297.1 hypothetical protein [Leptolyngbya sp. FACHB-711]